MNPDDLKQAWQTQSSQTKVTIDSQLLLQEVRRNQRSFTACIDRRDLREVGVGLVMVPVWFYLGIKASLPWSWYLTVPALLWIVGFFLVDRMRHQRPSEPGETLRERVEHSLADVEHQIWLLRNVFWWYLLPIILSSFAFVAHCAWLSRSGGRGSALILTHVIVVMVLMLAFIYWLNQNAVRTSLEPRRQELEALRAISASLKDEAPT
jgi:hypothetical protein